MRFLLSISVFFLIYSTVWASQISELSRVQGKSISTILSRITNGISSQQANQGSANLSYSSNGRYVAFESSASNLVSGDLNGLSDIFLYDTQTSTMTRLSIGLSSAEANGPSFEPMISADGAFVVFSSFASNLVSSDTNGKTDIFRVQVSNGAIVRVNLDSSGVQGNDSSAEPSISGDGNLVVFTSKSTNLVTSDTNAFEDVFVRNISAGTTTRISVNSSGTQGDNSSFGPRISADGSLVVFTSDAANLIGSDANSCSDVFVRNLSGGTTALVSSSSSGVIGNRSSWKADISDNGQFIVFQSRANNLISSDLNGYVDVFLKNTSTGATSLISQTSYGGQVKFDSFNSSISADGRFVVFESPSPGYAVWDNNNLQDVFIRDNLSGLTVPFSTLASDVIGNQKSVNAKISGDGAKFGFITLATNLVTPDTNGQLDILSRANPLTGQVVNISSIGDLDESTGAQNAFTVTRYGSTAANLVVHYSVLGTASSGSDYTALSGQVTIPSGSSSIIIPVDVLSDSIVEANESIVLALDPDSAYTIGGKDVASVNILIEDAFTVEIAAIDNMLYEDGLNVATFRISRSGGTLGDLIVNLTYSGGAVSASDYVALPSSVIIPAGQAYVDLTIIGIEDQFGESDELVTATLATGSGYNIGTNSSADVTLKDNDQFEVNVSAIDPIANESNTSDTGMFRIDRGTTGMQSLAINYVLKGTAQNGVDFVTLAGAITISAPNQYVDVPITAISDSIVEGAETVVLEILPGERYTPGPSQSATVIIKEDSILPTVSIESTDASATEDGTNTGTIRITRTGSTSSSLTVHFGIGGTAFNGTDYSAIASSATISSGQTYVDITITGVEDSLLESTENVVLGLQGTSTYQVDIVAYRTEVSILDNEVPTVQIVTNQVFVPESRKTKGKITVTRSGDLMPSLIVNLSLSGTATQNFDYSIPSSSLFFPSGSASQSLEFTASSDQNIEGTEKIVVSIAASSSYQIGPNSTSELVIVDRTYEVFKTVFGIAPNADVQAISISDNGRYIIFASAASNLVSGDSNGRVDIFRADLVGHTIIRAMAPGNQEPNGASRSPTISADGRYVAFSSLASNFYQDDFNQMEDIFLYDFTFGTTTYVSKGYTYMSQGGPSFDPAISKDGDYVVFASSAVNLVDGDTNGVADVFLFTKLLGSIERVSLTTGGAQFTQPSVRPSVTSNGKHITFESREPISGDSDLVEDVYLKNRNTGSLTRISVPFTGGANDGPSSRSKISAIGNSIIFQSYSSKLISADSNSASDIFVYAVSSGIVKALSQSEDGWLGSKASTMPSIGVNGDIALFISGSRNFGGGFNCTISAYAKSVFRNSIVAIDNGSFDSCSNPVREAAMALSGNYVVAVQASDKGFREILISSNPLK